MTPPSIQMGWSPSPTHEKTKILESTDSSDEESITETRAETNEYFLGEHGVGYSGGGLETEVGDTEHETDSQLPENDCPVLEDMPMHRPR